MLSAQKCWLTAALFSLLAVSPSALRAQAPAADATPTSTITLASSGAEPRQPLSYKFEAGQFTNYEVENKSTLTSQYENLKETVAQDTKTWKQYRVISVDEQGQALLEPVIRRVVMSARFNDADAIVCDSDKPEEAASQFRDVIQSVGKPVARVLFNTQGLVLKVSLLDGAPAHLAGPGKTSDPSVNFLIGLPKEAVGVGASWKERYSVPVTVAAGLTQSVTLQRSFQLTEFRGSLAVISLTTQVITPVNNPQISMQLIQRAPSGTIEFDCERGCVVGQRIAAAQKVVGGLGPANSVVEGSLQIVERWVPTLSAVQPAKLEAAAVTK